MKRKRWLYIALALIMLFGSAEACDESASTGGIGCPSGQLRVCVQRDTGGVTCMCVGQEYAR